MVTYCWKKNVNFPLENPKRLWGLFFVFGASFNFVLDVVPGKGFVSVCVLEKAEDQIAVCVTSARSFVLSTVTIASLLLFTVNKQGLLMREAQISAVV